MAFSNIEKSEKLDIIDIAIVENEEFKNNEIFKESFKVLSDENNEDRLFNTKYVTEESAKELLANDEITGYLLLTDTTKVVVNTSGINETILKYVAEEISQSEEIIGTVAEKRIAEMLATNPTEAGNLNSLYEKIYTEVDEFVYCPVLILDRILYFNCNGLLIWRNPWYGSYKSELSKYE